MWYQFDTLMFFHKGKYLNKNALAYSSTLNIQYFRSVVPRHLNSNPWRMLLVVMKVHFCFNWTLHRSNCIFRWFSRQNLRLGIYHLPTHRRGANRIFLMIQYDLKIMEVEYTGGVLTLYLLHSVEVCISYVWQSLSDITEQLLVGH